MVDWILGEIEWLSRFKRHEVVDFEIGKEQAGNLIVQKKDRHGPCSLAQVIRLLYLFVFCNWLSIYSSISQPPVLSQIASDTRRRKILGQHKTLYGCQSVAFKVWWNSMYTGKCHVNMVSGYNQAGPDEQKVITKLDWIHKCYLWS
jgi:hypothetical protein